MRIKRFTAPDMRTALRMIRDEQGPDAVILSNRPVEGGIEVVAATDYDEALVAQALRAAAPALELVPAPAPNAIAHAAPVANTTAANPPPAFASLLTSPVMASAEPTPTHIANTAPERESLMSRARAVFKTNETRALEAETEGLTLAELSARAAAPAPRAPLLAAAPALAQATSTLVIAANDNATAAAQKECAPAAPTRFEAMMAALNAGAQANVLPLAMPTPAAPMMLLAGATGLSTDEVASRSPPSPQPLSPQGRGAQAQAQTQTQTPALLPLAPPPLRGEGWGEGAQDRHAPTSPASPLPPLAPSALRGEGWGEGEHDRHAPTPATTSALDDWSNADDDYHVVLSAVAAPVAPVDPAPAAIVSNINAPTLHSVASPSIMLTAPDPAMLAMRADLATMRQLMERQMESLSLERLRGSPARAATYDALIGYGCEDVLAQAVAAKIDPRLEPSQIHTPMFTALAGMLTVARSEPLDEGGVIALVGPTGAGKTTTAAKLAARFAARHRARDVALVTTDGERAGAREQLHAHGRRLGITVCEAAGPEGLADALQQLADYPLVLVDTTGYAPRDRALFGQILWLRAARKVRCLLVLPANAHPHDLGEVIRRYRPASPEGVVLTKLDETGRLGSALSVAVRHGLTLSYTTHGQQVPADIDLADATRLAGTLEKLRRAADNPLATDDRATEDRHVFA